MDLQTVQRLDTAVLLAAVVLAAWLASTAPPFEQIPAAAQR